MPNIGCIGVAVNVGCPFELCGVGVTSADVAGLLLFQLLLSAQLVGLQWSMSKDVYLQKAKLTMT